MTNICFHENCNKNASYNFKNEKKRIYCSKHKSEGMVDITHKKCIYKNCIKRPKFNYKEEKKGVYCNQHKLEGMVSVSHKCCKHKDCNKQPSFNYNNKKNGIYCNQHKVKGMVIVIGKKCKHEKCKKQPCFNHNTEKSPLYCTIHKLNGMVDIRSKKCKIVNCYTQPIYNYPGENKGIYCNQHKLEGMINVKDKRCEMDICDIIPKNKKYDGYCTHCFANLFPNDTRTLLIKKKSKEIKVVSFITNKYNEWFHDKPLYVDLKGGCCNSKRRIDLRKLINGTLLCIEIDENQHKFYNKQDQLDRYDNLFMDFSGKYIFIRFNPDKYKFEGKTKNPRFEKRMKKLEEEIEKQTTRIKNDENKELVEIIKLFFDN